MSRVLRPLQPRPDRYDHDLPKSRTNVPSHPKQDFSTATATIESISRAFISAINNRIFSPLAPEWLPIAPNFRATFDSEPSTTLNRGQYLRWLALITSMNPDHLIRVLNVDVYVDEASGRAEAWMTGTTSSPVHADLVHQCVKVLEFAFSPEHGWLCVRYKRMKGPLGAEAVY